MKTASKSKRPSEPFAIPADFFPAQRLPSLYGAILRAATASFASIIKEQRAKKGYGASVKRGLVAMVKSLPAKDIESVVDALVAQLDDSAKILA